MLFYFSSYSENCKCSYMNVWNQIYWSISQLSLWNITPNCIFSYIWRKQKFQIAPLVDFIYSLRLCYLILDDTLLKVPSMLESLCFIWKHNVRCIVFFYICILHVNWVKVCFAFILYVTYIEQIIEQLLSSACRAAKLCALLDTNIPRNLRQVLVIVVNVMSL